MIQTLDPQVLPQCEHAHILHAVGWRDGKDALLTCAAGIGILLMIAGVAGLLGGVVYLATDSVRAASLVLLAGWVLLALILAFTVVHWMRIDARGITLGRRAGRPRFVAWDDVTGIRPAARREVIVDGWLWPPVPPREATRCLSSLGHYRIDHRGGFFFYPPADEHQFLAAVEHWRARHDAGHAPGSAG